MIFIFFQNLKSKNIHHYSRFTDEGPSIVERVIKTIRNFLKKPVFEKGNAGWLRELPSVIKKYNNTIHNSTKMKPVYASKKVNEKSVFNNLQDKTEKQKPNSKLRQLFRTADIKSLSKGDSTKWSHKIYTITKVIHDTIPSYRIDFLPERYNQNLLPTKLTLEENNQVMKKLNLIQKYILYFFLYFMKNILKFELTENGIMVLFVNIVIEIVYYHMNLKGLVLLVDIT